MPNVLLFGDDKYASLRNEVPLALPDPVAYLEVDGGRTIVCGFLDVPRLKELGGYDVLSFEELGLNELLADGMALPDAFRVLVGRACERLSLRDAVVPADFPLELADFLRGEGVTLAPNGGVFDLRRRAKTPAQLDGIRRAQHAAQRAMAHLREQLGTGRALTAEELRAGARRIFVENGAVPHPMLVVAAGAHGADPHDEGAGSIPEGVPIVVDIFPRDMESGCWGDITRTFCIGEPPEELRAWHAAVHEAQSRAMDAVRPGISGGEPYAIACDVLESAGYETRRTATEADLAAHGGFIHYLGHGLGLELHEAPTLDDGGEILVPGDVVTIEPGLYRPGFGGCRIEDVVVVTDDGYELLTDFPYDLTV